MIFWRNLGYNENFTEKFLYFMVKNKFFSYICSLEV